LSGQCERHRVEERVRHSCSKTSASGGDGVPVRRESFKPLSITPIPKLRYQLYRWLSEPRVVASAPSPRSTSHRIIQLGWKFNSLALVGTTMRGWYSPSSEESGPCPHRPQQQRQQARSNLWRHAHDVAPDHYGTFRCSTGKPMPSFPGGSRGGRVGTRHLHLIAMVGMLLTASKIWTAMF